MLAGRNFISPLDFHLEEWDEVFALADDIIGSPDTYREIARGRVLATLFFEPSTRTRLSFEAAMLRLGGQVLGFSDASSSSTTKGETVADTARMIGAYADIIAMRHPSEGAPKAASLYAGVPVINAGDGGHQHPTQTLTDLYTIKTATGRLNHLTVGLCGDLKFGRTVHSLIEALGRFEEITFYAISPEELVLPNYIIAQMEKNPAVKYIPVRRLEECMDKLDVLYMTRIQGERFDSREDYLRLRDVYILNRDKLASAKADLVVLHPLPRVNEIATDVDTDPRAWYFKQAQYGMYARMALLVKLLGADKGMDAKGGQAHRNPHPDIKSAGTCRCENEKCISHQQPTLPILDNGHGGCGYCDREWGAE